MAQERIASEAPEGVRPEHARKRRRVLVRVVPWLLAAIVVGGVIGFRSLGRLAPSPLPAGQYEDLALATSPKGAITSSSRFVFESAQGYYFASPTTSTVYALGGKTVTKKSFESALANIRPMHIFVSADGAGRLAVLNLSQ